MKWSGQTEIDPHAPAPDELLAMATDVPRVRAADLAAAAVGDDPEYRATLVDLTADDIDAGSIFADEVIAALLDVIANVLAPTIGPRAAAILDIHAALTTEQTLAQLES